MEPRAAHPNESCVTCSDEAVEMGVVAVDSERSIALCSTAQGARLSIEVGLLEPVAVGEVLLVHAGTAIARAQAPA